MPYIGFYLSEYQSHYTILKYVHEYYDERRYQKCCQYQLIGSCVCLVVFLLSQILPHYNRTACSQCCHDIYHQYDDRVDKRHCRYRGFSYACYHHRVNKSNCKQKELLYEQRPEQLEKEFIREQRRVVQLYDVFLLSHDYLFTISLVMHPKKDCALSTVLIISYTPFYEKNSFMESRKLLFF